MLSPLNESQHIHLQQQQNVSIVPVMS